MKKFALLTVAAAAVLNLAACGLEHVDAPPSATPDTAEYFAVAEPGAEAAYYELPREFGRHIAAGGTAVRCPGGSGCEAYAMEGAGLTRLESRELKAGYERFGREYSIEVYWCERDGAAVVTGFGGDGFELEQVLPGNRALVGLDCRGAAECGAYPVVLNLESGEVEDAFAACGLESLCGLTDFELLPGGESALVTQSAPEGNVYWLCRLPEGSLTCLNDLVPANWQGNVSLRAAGEGLSVMETRTVGFDAQDELGYVDCVLWYVSPGSLSVRRVYSGPLEGASEDGSGIYPGGGTALLSDERGVRGVSLATGETFAVSPEPFAGRVSFSPDGERAALMRLRGDARIERLEIVDFNAKTVCELPLPDAGISPDSLRWADDERLVIDDGEYDPTRVWLYTLK